MFLGKDLLLATDKAIARHLCYNSVKIPLLEKRHWKKNILEHQQNKQKVSQSSRTNSIIELKDLHKARKLWGTFRLFCWCSRTVFFLFNVCLIPWWTYNWGQTIKNASIIRNCTTMILNVYIYYPNTEDTIEDTKMLKELDECCNYRIVEHWRSISFCYKLQLWSQY